MLIRFLCSAPIPRPSLGLWKRSTTDTVISVKASINFMTFLLLLDVERGNPWFYTLMLKPVSNKIVLILRLFGASMQSWHCSLKIWLQVTMLFISGSKGLDSEHQYLLKAKQSLSVAQKMSRTKIWPWMSCLFILWPDFPFFKLHVSWILVCILSWCLAA